MQKAHSRINWENLPSINTPLGANNLNKMDKAIDVVDDRVLSLYGYEGRVQASEKNAKASETNAKTSETNARQSELKAKEYAEHAFSGTPEGYEQLVEDVRLMDIQTTTEQTLANSKEGGYKLLSMSGNSVQNGIPTPDAPQSIENVGDCVEMMQGGWWYDGSGWRESAVHVCNKIPIPCKSGDVIKVDLENATSVFAIYHNASGYVSYSTLTNTNTATFTVPSGITHFYFTLGGSNVITPSTVGKITLTINGKYVAQIRTYDDNGKETVAPVLLNAPLCETDLMSNKEVVRKRASVVFDGSDDEVWQYQTLQDNSCFIIPISNFNYVSDVELNYLCTHYSAITTAQRYIDKTIFINSDSNVFITDNSFTTLADFKTWLASNPVTVEYELAEEVIEELDTDSQIALNSLETFDTVTYINVDSRVQPSEIKGEYGTSMVGARTIKNELRNDTLEIKYNELAVALAATESGVQYV